MKITAAWPRLRLSSWITIGVVTIVLITTLSLLLLVDQFAKNYARNQAQVRLKQLAWQMRDAIDQSMNARVLDIQSLARRDSISNNRNPQVLRRVLNQVQNDFSDYAWIGVTDTNGVVQAATQAMLEGQDVTQRPWYAGAQNALFVGDYHPALLLEHQLPATVQPWRFVDIALPIFDLHGMYRGVLGAHLSWTWARALASNLLIPTNNRYQVEILVVRDDGTVLLGPKGLEEKKISQNSLALSRQSDANAMVEEWGDGIRYITGAAGISSWRAGKNLNWSILVRQPELIALADFASLEKQVLLLGSLIGLLLVACAILLSRRLVAPMNVLSAALEQRVSGTGAGDIPLVHSYYEINLLSSTLATMVAREGRHLSEAKSLNENLEQHVAERTDQLAQTALALGQALAVQQESQILLEESENELRTILQNTSDAFVAIDETGCIREWNRQAEKLFGWSREQALNQSMAELIIPAALRPAHERGMARFLRSRDSTMINNRIEINGLRSDGSEVPIELVIGHIERRQGYLFIAFLHDISERQALRVSLESQAFTDVLTGLLNRRAFLQKLPEALARSVRYDEGLAVLFMDIDGFKRVNDTYGHHAGDQILCQFARRIEQQLREIDTVARLAGDEFIVILERLLTAKDALYVAGKILDAMRLPFVFNALEASVEVAVEVSFEVSLSTSIGMTMFRPGDSSTPELLMTRADNAMYAAKRAGKNQIHSDAI